MGHQRKVGHLGHSSVQYSTTVRTVKEQCQVEVNVPTYISHREQGSGLVGLSCRSETSVHSAPAAIDLKDYSATSDALCSLSFGLRFTEAPINLSSVTLTFVSKSVTGQTWAIHIRLYIVFFSLHFLWRAHYAVTAEANSSPLHVSMCLSVNVF